MATRETQALIIESAVNLFNQHGTARVSTNRIAQACGISKGNLHYHFRNKESIVQSIYDQMIMEVRRNWRDDHLDPTIQHMAEMYERQLMLIWNYRFFYRELVALLRHDSQLKATFSEYRNSRTAEIVRFFKALITAGVMRQPEGAQSLESLVRISWILSDNWINYIEVDGHEISPQTIREGYALVIELFRPYLTEAALLEIQHYPLQAGSPSLKAASEQPGRKC
ncbi:MAG: TetR/AcrR family transcriptional regulator [Gammaproteobacteria bacterium]|nr:TetR/AcrR family transcriptional regulator [Gammaproteobacteria bacterium]